MSDYSDAILGELRRAGVAFRMIRRSKRILVEWTGRDGVRRLRSCEAHAKSYRAVENARHDVRRMLRLGGDLGHGSAASAAAAS